MLSLLKKPTDQAKSANAIAAWHPNFRDDSLLPDTKVVRTAFFINALAALLVAIMLGLVVKQEVSLAELGGQVAQLDAQLDKNRGPNSLAGALYKKFQDEEKKVADVNSFVALSKIELSGFYYELAATLPKRVALKSIDLTEAGAVLRGVVSGSPEQASGVVTAYEKVLRDTTTLSKSFASISVSNLTKDAQSGRMLFEIVLHFATAKKDKKP